MTAMTHEQARRSLHVGRDSLDATERAALDAHLAECAECNAYAARLAALKPTLSRAMRARWEARLSPSTDFADQVRTRLQKNTVRRRILNFAGSLAGAGMLAVMLILFSWALQNRSAGPSTPSPEPTSPATVSPVPTNGLSVTPTGLIAFESERDGNREVYVMNANGSGQTNLTNNLADDYGPSWSPDGRRIAFISERTGVQEVFVVNADGSDVIQLTHDSPEGCYDYPVSWSPVGAQLALSYRPGCKTPEADVYLVKTDGSGAILLTRAGSCCSSPKWSPDGKHLAFGGQPDQIPALFVINADGRGLVNITEGESASADNYHIYLGFDWSPDGTRLAYLSEGPWLGSGPDAHISSDSHARLNVVNADGAEKTTILDLQPGPDGIHYLSWSPDGAYLMFVSDVKNDGCWVLHLMRPDGSRLTPLNGPCYTIRTYAPDWSMDSQWLVFTAEWGRPSADAEIAAINVNDALQTPDNVKPIRLTNSPGLDVNPQWQPAREQAETATATPTPEPASAASARAPDGLIAFESQRDHNGEIYVMNADGSGQTNLTHNPAGDYNPVWSPDGARLAFLSDRTGHPEIFLLDVAEALRGSETAITQLTNDPEAKPGLMTWDFGMAWSPDGTRLLVQHTRFPSNGSSESQYAILNADGSGLTPLPAIPDGARLVYSTAGGVRLMNVDGSQPTTLLEFANPSYRVSWSPDGPHLMLLIDPAPGEKQVILIYLLNADGSGLTRLPDLDAIGYPGWSSDGQWITYESNRDGDVAEIYALNVAEAMQQDPDHLRPIRLTNAPGADSGEHWQPFGPKTEPLIAPVVPTPTWL